MTDTVRVGLVGADAAGGSWGSVAHIPAIRAADGVELAAVCTGRPESAAAAGEAFGVPSFHDVRDLAAQPDIDIISVVVRVPKHRELVLPALEAGKHVFCEWPLGANLVEAEEMAQLGRERDVVTAVGLQGRHDPSLTYIRELHDEGWFGDVVSVNVRILTGGALARRSAGAWMGRSANGANLMTIVGGHTIDAVAYCLSPFAELSGMTATRIREWHLTDTDETVAVDAPDAVLLSGTLEGGAVVSYHAASVPFNASGWQMEIYGTAGTIRASTTGLPQITPVVLSGARGSEPLVELALPDRLTDRAPGGPAGNIARAYAHLASAVRAGDTFTPDFEHARRLHELLDLIQRSSDEGRAVTVG